MVVWATASEIPSPAISKTEREQRTNGLAIIAGLSWLVTQGISGLARQFGIAARGSPGFEGEASLTAGLFERRETCSIGWFCQHELLIRQPSRRRLVLQVAQPDMPTFIGSWISSKQFPSTRPAQQGEETKAAEQGS
jgi:hypothetical protein